MAKKKNNHDHIAKFLIAAVIIIVILIIALFKNGILGNSLNNIFKYLLGDYCILPILSILILLAIRIIFRNIKVSLKYLITVIIINLVIINFLTFLNTKQVGFGLFKNYPNFLEVFKEQELFYAGGLVGNLSYASLSSLLDRSGTLILLISLIIIAILLVLPYKQLNLYINQLFDDSKKSTKTKDSKIEKSENNNQNNNIIDLDKTSKASQIIDLKLASEDKKFKEEEVILSEKVEDNYISNNPHYVNYKKPPLSLLESVKINNDNENLNSAKIKGDQIVEILANFDIAAKLLDIHVGPSVTKFEIKPDSSIKVSKILNIADNIKMELAAKNIRIEAPIPGKNAVGIEIPNEKATPVRMLEVFRKIPKEKSQAKLLFVLGKDLLGNAIFCELDKMPHLLVAGSTGSGKSVCMNTIITSLLIRTTPDELKLLLIDPKKVEFSPYHDIPHLLWPVVTDATMANNSLKKIVSIMDERFELFASVGVKNIAGYNSYVDKQNEHNEDKIERMPYIVIIIDELADLMVTCGKDVELSIQRITQLARASGIHMIVATQRPSTDVITGLIKTNIPSRIAFSVASSIDSRTILDQTGADKLLGYGDMLYSPMGSTSPTRVQGVYILDEEINRITDFCKKQAKPLYDDSFFSKSDFSEGTSIINDKNLDPLFEEAKEFVIETQKASTSLLQRKFAIGYNRAARLIDVLEEKGIIGPVNGSKPREVFYKNNEEE